MQLTDMERRAVEDRLGCDTESWTARSRLLIDLLETYPEHRRASLLAHAFIVYPYVRRVGSERFVIAPLAGDVRARCIAEREPAFASLLEEAATEQWNVQEFASRFLAFIRSMTYEERIVMLAYAIWKAEIAPYARWLLGRTLRGKSTPVQISATEIAVQAPELRDRVIELRGMLEFLPCMPSPVETMREFFAKLARIEDPDVRAMVLTHLIGDLANAVARDTAASMVFAISVPELLALLGRIRDRLQAVHGIDAEQGVEGTGDAEALPGIGLFGGGVKPKA